MLAKIIRSKFGGYIIHCNKGQRRALEIVGHSTVIWTENIKNQNCLFHSIPWQIENILVIVCENGKLCLLSVVVYA